MDTIHIVLTKEADCDILVKMTSAIKVNMKFDMDYDDFFNNGHEASLTSDIASFLGISPDRVRIVNIRRGSVIVDQVILPEQEN